VADQGLQGRTDLSTSTSDASVGELVGRVATDLSTLMRQELELAKAEVKTEAATAGKAAGMLGAGGVAALYALGFLSLAIVYALSLAMDAWIAALIVGLVWAIAAAVLVVVGKNKISQVDPKPERTIKTVKEDVEWAKNRGK